MGTIQLRLVAFVLAVGVLGAMTVINLRYGRIAAASDQEVARMHEIRTSMRDLVSALQDVETGARGFVLTGTPDYLEPYIAGSAAVGNHTESLRTLLVEPVHQQDFATLEALIGRRADAAHELVRTRQTEGFEAAHRLVVSGHGKAAMAQVRAHLARMDDGKRRLLDAQAEASTAAARMQQATVAGAAVSFLLLVGLFALVLRDSRLRARTLEDLARSERQLHAAVDTNTQIMRHSLDVICTIDGEGHFVFVSDASAAVWGYPPDELVGRLFMDFVHPDDHAKTEAASAAIAGGTSARDFSNRYLRKDGSVVPILWTATWSPEAQLVFCVARDISDRAAADALLQTSEERFRRTNEQLEMASRHKDEFLANMSHELRTPLNAILGLSEALLERLSGPLTPRQEKFVTTISTSGTHLLALINDILDLSKVEAGKLDLFVEEIDVNTFGQSCLAFIRSQAMQKELEVVVDETDAPATIQADPKRLRQIVVNLLTNAVKFSTRGGRIGLTVRSSPDANGVCLSVWDTGIGIATADQPKLFQSFSQIDSGLSRAQDGSGLGLALVARLTELHGGSVSVVSAPGEGSEFTVTLPYTQAHVATAAPPDRRHISTALIIDDDPLVSEQLVRYLDELDIDGRIHTTGDLALEAAQRALPEVILLDLQLPGQSGWAVLGRLKADPDTKDIPVVVISVLDEQARSLALGAAAHLTKPITREQLATFFQRQATSRDQTGRRTAPAPAPRPPVVLLAEDNAANVVTIGGYLEDRGFVVHYAANGVEAIDRTRRDRPDVILMDIQMPVLDGLSAIQEIRRDERVRHIPIVALTALAMTGDRERCLAAGASDYMTKPVSMRALAAVVTQLATRSTEVPA